LEIVKIKITFRTYRGKRLDVSERQIGFIGFKLEALPPFILPE
jgi:hypothetical protein